LGVRLRGEDALYRSHRVGQSTPIIVRDSAHQRGDLVVGASVQPGERGATCLGEPQMRLTRIAFRARLLDQLPLLEAAKYPTEVTGIESELARELGGGRPVLMRELIQHADFSE